MRGVTSFQLKFQCAFGKLQGQRQMLVGPTCMSIPAFGPSADCMSCTRPKTGHYEKHAEHCSAAAAPVAEFPRIKPISDPSIAKTMDCGWQLVIQLLHHVWLQAHPEAHHLWISALRMSVLHVWSASHDYNLPHGT
jgi:hypothetical protein